MRLKAILLAPAVVVALVSTASAQVSPEIVKATAGEWLIAAQNGKPGCRVTLSAEPAIGGHALTIPPHCAQRLPRIARAAAWRFDGQGGLALADATRRTLIAFGEEQEGALYRGKGTPEDQDIVMVKAPTGVEELPNASKIFGRWTMRRPGGADICTVTFLDKPPPGGEESYALTLSTNCDAAVKRLKLASWRIETLDLMLYGTDGASLALTPNASGGFSKAAREGGRPLEMAKAR